MWVDCWSCSQFKKEIPSQEQFTYVWQASMQGNPALLQWGKLHNYYKLKHQFTNRGFYLSGNDTPAGKVMCKQWKEQIKCKYTDLIRLLCYTDDFKHQFYFFLTVDSVIKYNFFFFDVSIHVRLSSAPTAHSLVPAVSIASGCRLLFFLMKNHSCSLTGSCLHWD